MWVFSCSEEVKMTITVEKLAESLGVTPGTISKAKKKLGIESKSLSESQADAISNYLQGTSLKIGNSFEEKPNSEDFVPNVREIDKKDDSSMLDFLQDCKEQYVENQRMLKRLQYEIESQSSMIVMNGNRTVSISPHFKPIESLQKINIQLRNQIISIEDALGRDPKADKDDDPFA